jgi:hypothetical protein
MLFHLFFEELISIDETMFPNNPFFPVEKDFQMTRVVLTFVIIGMKNKSFDMNSCFTPTPETLSVSMTDKINFHFGIHSKSPLQSVSLQRAVLLPLAVACRMASDA